MLEPLAAEKLELEGLTYSAHNCQGMPGRADEAADKSGV